MLRFCTANGGTAEEKINSISILSSEGERETCNTFLQLEINKSLYTESNQKRSNIL